MRCAGLVPDGGSDGVLDGDDEDDDDDTDNDCDSGSGGDNGDDGNNGNDARLGPVTAFQGRLLRRATASLVRRAEAGGRAVGSAEALAWLRRALHLQAAAKPSPPVRPPVVPPVDTAAYAAAAAALGSAPEHLLGPAPLAGLPPVVSHCSAAGGAAGVAASPGGWLTGAEAALLARLARYALPKAPPKTPPKTCLKASSDGASGASAASGASGAGCEGLSEGLSEGLCAARWLLGLALAGSPRSTPALKQAVAFAHLINSNSSGSSGGCSSGSSGGSSSFCGGEGTGLGSVGGYATAAKAELRRREQRRTNTRSGAGIGSGTGVSGRGDESTDSASALAWAGAACGAALCVGFAAGYLAASWRRGR